jgi:RHS repeat-associated protein
MLPLPAPVVAQDDLIPPTSTVADPMHDRAPSGSRHPGDEGNAPYQPSWSFAFERQRPGTVDAQAAWNNIYTYTPSSAAGWSRSVPPAAAAPTTPTAPTNRLFTDGLGRPLRAEVTERDASGTLSFVTLTEHEYSSGATSWARTDVRLDRPAGAEVRGTAYTYFDGWARAVQRYVLDPSGVWDPSWSFFDSTGTSTSSMVAGRDERYPWDYAASWTITDALGRVSATSTGQLGGTYIAGAANLIEYFHRTGPAAASAPTRARFYSESSGAGPRRRVFSDLWGRAVATDIEVETGVWLRSQARYDGLGRAVESIEPDGSVVRTRFDLLGRATESQRFGSISLANSGITPSRTEISEFDLDGKVLATTSLSGQTQYDYDALGRLERVRPPTPSGGALSGHGNTEYSYQDVWTKDGFGQIRKTQSPTETITVSFDARGRVIEEQHSVALSVTAPSDGATVSLSDQYTFALQYNRAGQPIRIEHRDPAIGVRRAVELEHDARARVQRVYDVNASGVRRLLAHNHWRWNNTLDHRSDDFGGTVTPLHEWDGMQRGMSVALGATTQWSTSIARAAATRWPTSITTNPGDGPAHTATITHDLSGRLQHVTNPGLSYDLTLERDPSNLARTGRIVQSAPGDLARDVVPQYRAAGGAAGPDPGAITELRRPDGSALVANLFDADGTVIERAGVGATGLMRADEHGRVRERGAHRYFFDAEGERSHVFNAEKERIVAHVGLLDIQYKRVGASFVRERVEFIVPGGNVPLARVNEDSGAVAFLHTDAQGSVAYVRGGVAADSVRFDYTPFGEVLSARATGSFSADRETRRFQGGVTDASGTGYIQFGARLYDPVTQQWASADPAFHSYAYGFVNDSPYLGADPSGLKTEGMPGHEVTIEESQREWWVDKNLTENEAHTFPTGAFSRGGVWAAFSRMVRPRHPVLIDSRAEVPAIVGETAGMANAAERLMARLPHLPNGLPLTGIGLAAMHLESAMRLPGAIYTTASGRNSTGSVASAEEAAGAGAAVGAAAATIVFEGGGYVVRGVGRAANSLRRILQMQSRMNRGSPRLFPNLYPDDVPQSAFRRRLRMFDGAWYEHRPNGGAYRAKGRWTVVRQNDELLGIPTEDALGHIDVAQGLPVEFAGNMQFGGSKRAGQLLSWDNASGHYQVPADWAHQSGLPMPLFEPWVPSM